MRISKDEFRLLPGWLTVTLTGRAVRRVEPFFREQWPSAPRPYSYAVDRAIAAAEQRDAQAAVRAIQLATSAYVAAQEGGMQAAAAVARAAANAARAAAILQELRRDDGRPAAYAEKALQQASSALSAQSMEVWWKALEEDLRRAEQLLTQDLTLRSRQTSAELLGPLWLAGPPSSWPVPTPLPPPIRTIGRYDLLEKLDEGGFAEVYLAWDGQEAKEVALKLPKRTDREVVNRFRREWGALKRLNHPNIVRMVDYPKELDGTFFIVFEYIRGATLRRRLPLASDSTGLKQALCWAHQLALALQHAEGQGVVHRDLKPENVMIDEHEDARLLDFGLGKHLMDDPTFTSTLVGTIAYMSPEQASYPDLPIDHRTDLYSLGVILYECLTGRRPFEHPAPLGLLQLIREGQPSPPCDLNPAIPESIQAMCLKAMACDPGRRYQCAEEFVRALAEELEH